MISIDNGHTNHTKHNVHSVRTNINMKLLNFDMGGWSFRKKKHTWKIINDGTDTYLVTE